MSSKQSETPGESVQGEGARSAAGSDSQNTMPRVASSPQSAGPESLLTENGVNHGEGNISVQWSAPNLREQAVQPIPTRNRWQTPDYSSSSRVAFDNFHFEKEELWKHFFNAGPARRPGEEGEPNDLLRAMCLAGKEAVGPGRATIVPSTTEAMRNHLLECKFVHPRVKALVEANALTERRERERRASSANQRAYFTPPMSDATAATRTEQVEVPDTERLDDAQMEGNNGDGNAAVAAAALIANVQGAANNGAADAAVPMDQEGSPLSSTTPAGSAGLDDIPPLPGIGEQGEAAGDPR